MSDFISGLIGVGLVFAFLAFMAIGIKSVPLSIIIAGVLALPVIDFVQTVRKGKNRSGD